MDKNEVLNHQIADALQTLVDSIRELQRTTDMRDDGATLVNETVENKIARHTLNNLDNWLLLTQNGAEKLEWTMLSVRSVCPFEQVSDERKEEIFENLLDQMRDSRPIDMTRDTTDNWSEWQWKAESDELAEIDAEDEE